MRYTLLLSFLFFLPSILLSNLNEQEAIKLFDKIKNDLLSEGEVYFIGQVEDIWSHYSKSDLYKYIDQLQILLNFFNNLKEKKLSNLILNKNDPETLELFDDLDNRLAKIFWCLSFLHISLDEIEIAREYAQKEIRLNKAMNAEDSYIGFLYWDYAFELFDKKGLYNEALAYYDSSLSYYQKINDKPQIVRLIDSIWRVSKESNSELSNYYRNLTEVYGKIYASEFPTTYYNILEFKMESASTTQEILNVYDEFVTYGKKHKMNLNIDYSANYKENLLYILKFYYQEDYNFRCYELLKYIDKIYYQNTDDFEINDYHNWLDILQKQATLSEFWDEEFIDEYNIRLQNERIKISEKIQLTNNFYELSNWYFMLYKIDLINSNKTNFFYNARLQLDQAIQCLNSSKYDENDLNAVQNHLILGAKLFTEKVKVYPSENFSLESLKNSLDFSKKLDSTIQKFKFNSNVNNENKLSGYLTMHNQWVNAPITANELMKEIISSNVRLKQEISNLFYFKGDIDNSILYKVYAHNLLDDTILNYDYLYKIKSNLLQSISNLCLKKHVDDDFVNQEVLKALGVNVGELDWLDIALIYNKKAIANAEDWDLPRLLESLYYELAEIYIKKNELAKAVIQLNYSKEYNQKNIASIIKSGINNQQKKVFINKENRIVQLLSYCYNKMKFPELVITNIDYFKSYTTKEILNINPDLTSQYLALQDQLLENEAIIAFTNIDTKDLYDSVQIIDVLNPIIIYIDKNHTYSFPMYTNNKINSDFNFQNFSIWDSNHLKKMYDLLIKPCENILIENSIRSITIIPESYIFAIPFEALINSDNKYLVENYNINYTNSFAMLANNSNSNSKSSKILAIGNPVYENNIDYNIPQLSNNDITRAISNNKLSTSNFSNLYLSLGYSGWKNLPGTEKEIQFIADNFFNSTILDKHDASKTTILNLSNENKLADYDIIHFACHGFYNDEHPTLSALVLTTQSNNSIDDGYLRLNEIANLKLNTRLVNLSACSTSKGKMYELEGVDGFIQAFFNAGSQSVLSTLWDINDNSSQIFMKEFYTNYLINNDFDLSLNQTKLNFIKGIHGEQYKHPFYWSPYTYFYRN